MEGLAWGLGLEKFGNGWLIGGWDLSFFNFELGLIKV